MKPTQGRSSINPLIYLNPRNRVSPWLSEAVKHEKHDDLEIRDRRVDINATMGKGSNVPGPGRGTRGPGHDDDDDDRLVVKP